MGILEKIKDIEHEMARTQKNKATEYHLGLLKGKLARLRSQLIDDAKSGGGGGAGFEARKAGDARVALVGFPSVGKSTLLNKLTQTESEVASYEFTTLTCVPGVVEYNGARIQLLDLPGIIEGASEGKGRGKQVIATARTADVVLMMLDASKGEVHKRLLQRELETCGIRLNRPRPNIYFRAKKTGGITYTQTCAQTKGISDKLVKDLLMHTYRIHNAEVIVRYDASIDDFIDVVEGNRQYIRCLYVYNKIDTINIEQVDELARKPDSVVISCEWGLNLDFLLSKIWEYLDLNRVFTKKKGCPPDFAEPVIMRRPATVEHLCHTIHKDMVAKFRHAIVYGKSTKHDGQRCGLSHELADEDVIQVMTDG